MTRNRRPVTALTELVLTGTPAEVQALTAIAADSGRLYDAEPARPMAGIDPRIRVRLWLIPTHT